MVRLRKDAFVEEVHHPGEDHADPHQGHQGSDRIHSASRHGGDLVLGREIAEGVEHRNEDRHWKRQRDRVRHGQGQELQNGGQREPFAHDIL